MRAVRESVYRIVVSSIVFIPLAMGAMLSRAHASPGGTIQGPLLQGTEHDGAWLRGTQLVGILPRATPGKGGKRDILVEIHGFRGDTVDAVRRDVGRGLTARVALHPRDLVGLEWPAEVCSTHGGCQPIVHRIAAVTQDRARNTMGAHADNGDVWLYELHYTTARNPGPRDWQNVCPRQDGHEPVGLFVDGQWDRRGGFSPRGHTFSCATGVIAKCARDWGYKPWKHAARVPWQPLHLACVRAARADYCGDGIPHTRHGTTIDLFDGHALNRSANLPGFTDEAAFDSQGAVWVQHPRYPTGTPGKTGWRFDTCQRPHPRGQRSAGAALIFVSSRPAADAEAPGERARTRASARVRPRQRL